MNKRDYEKDWQEFCLIDGLTEKEMKMRGYLRYWMFEYSVNAKELEQYKASDADKERYATELYNRAKNAEDKIKDLESEVNRLQVALEATIAEKERCRLLAVDWSLKADGYKASLDMCQNMKLAHEFEELLQTTSIPVAVEKVRAMLAVVAAVKSVCAGCPNEAKCNPDACVYGAAKQPLSVLERS